MFKKKAGIAVCAVAACALALTGCSSGHQIVDSENSCVSCHSDKSVVSSEQTPTDATKSGGTVTVKASGADRVYICKPAFTNENGTHYVPVKTKAVSLSDGSATVELEEGLWVIAKDNGDSSDCALIEVKPDYTDEPEVTL